MEDPSSLLGSYQPKICILNALDALMGTTSFDKITVTEICSEAHISRATFYRYFRDKYAIPQWHLEFAYSQGTNEIGRTLSWCEGYYITEATIAERREFYTNVARSDDYNSIDNYAPRMRKKTIAATVADYQHQPLTERLRFQIDAAVELEVHLLPKWHYGAYDASLEEICSWMADAVPRELFRLLDTPLKPSGVISPVTPHHSSDQSSLV